MTNEVRPATERDHVVRPTRYRITQHLLARVGNVLRRIVVRDRSAQGMLVEADDLRPGEQVTIELPSGRLVSGTVRWAKTGRAGIELNVVAHVVRPYDFVDVEAFAAGDGPGQGEDRLFAGKPPA